MNTPDNNTTSAKVKAPATMTPSNESLSLIEWAAHQQALWKKAAENVANQEWLAKRGYEVAADEIFAS